MEKIEPVHLERLKNMTPTVLSGEAPSNKVFPKH